MDEYPTFLWSNMEILLYIDSLCNLKEFLFSIPCYFIFFCWRSNQWWRCYFGRICSRMTNRQAHTTRNKLSVGFNQSKGNNLNCRQFGHKKYILIENLLTDLRKPSRTAIPITWSDNAITSLFWPNCLSFCNQTHVEFEPPTTYNHLEKKNVTFAKNLKKFTMTSQKDVKQHL